MPSTVEPQLATLVVAPPEGDDWLHEIKLDGYRLLCRCERGKVRLITRGALDWTDRFSTLAAALAELPVRSAILDGEAVALDAQGRSSFEALQRALSERSGARTSAHEPARPHPRGPDLHLFLFDLLYLDGYDLRRTPLLERKELLRRVLANAAARGSGAASPLHFNDHVRGQGAALFEHACRSGVEGIVSKRALGRYESARTRSWLKTKCTRRQEMVVVGWSDPSGSRVGLGALLLGVHDRGELRYAGKVGTGFDHAELRELRERLGALVRDRSAAAGAPRSRGLHWVEPELVAEIEFTEWTRDGKIRHPRFLGLREDKRASEVRREREQTVSAIEPAPAAPQRSQRTRAARPKRAAIAPSSPKRTAIAPATRKRGAGSDAPASRSKPEHGERAKAAIAKDSAYALPPPIVPVVAGVRLSTPERVYFPELGVTKSELAQYYERMADRVLPGLVERPLSMVRCPESWHECFYQKRANRSIPKGVPRVVVKKGREAYAMITDLPSLISLVQVGVLEFHVWGARADRLDRPDVLIFDLDPGPDVSWRDLADTATLLRRLLEELGLVPFLRTTGGKGLHLVTPILRRSSWEEVKELAHAIARQLVQAAPDRYTDEVAKAKRRGRIYIDYLRNDPESTAIASWSVRAREGAPVAATMFWDELDSPEPPRWNVRTAASRLALPDPWESYERSRRPLTAAMRRRLGL